MPTTIFLKGGVRFQLKGDGPGTVIKRFLRPMAVGISLTTGHLIEFKWRDRILVDPQPEAEFQAELAKQKAAQDEQAKGQAESQAKAEKEKDAALAKAAEDFIAKYGPDKAGWPESLRPKAPAPDAAQN
jgi:hypothetical protein